MKDDEIELVMQKLKWLRLPGMADQLPPEGRTLDPGSPPRDDPTGESSA